RRSHQRLSFRKGWLVGRTGIELHVFLTEQAEVCYANRGVAMEYDVGIDLHRDVSLPIANVDFGDHSLSHPGHSHRRFVVQTSDVVEYRGDRLRRCTTNVNALNSQDEESENAQDDEHEDADFCCR